MSLKVLVLVGVLLSVCVVCLQAAPQAEKYEAVSSKNLSVREWSYVLGYLLQQGVKI